MVIEHQQGLQRYIQCFVLTLPYKIWPHNCYSHAQHWLLRYRSNNSCTSPVTKLDANAIIMLELFPSSQAYHKPYQLCWVQP